MANIIKTHGFVLNTVPFKESSMFVSLLTKQNGKVKLVAKGVRRPKSRLCGALERFCLDEIIYYRRESKEIYTLSDAVVLQAYDAIRICPQRVNAAHVLCEFFDKTLPPEEPHTHAFSLLNNFLAALTQVHDEQIKSTTYAFLLRALPDAGIHPRIDSCVRCHVPITYNNKRVDFSIGAGGVVCERDFDDTVVFMHHDTLDVLDGIYKNRSVVMTDQTVADLARLLPDYLYYHLDGLSLNSLKHL
ncbi:MAG: DNA repair protein RecO [candidate division WOR-3 bacterium]|nr:MAG: DNA repair protein RecO [candidate division WOR-3 bacterium]